MVGLVDKEHIGGSIPAPFSGGRLQAAGALLDDLARAILGEQAKHGTRAGPAVEHHCQRRGWLAGTNKPEEEVCWGLAGDGNPAGVLLLPSESSRTDILGFFVRDLDVRVGR